ncbi:hypothetical protein ABZ915_07990 [Streptomyces sp. NPDC046915]|uniref:hypothetical protein n=1 Tax=Streptomyces sp. NPDC046915 TaxID=3155257 RepID=UPI0033D541B2
MSNHRKRKVRHVLAVSTAGVLVLAAGVVAAASASEPDASGSKTAAACTYTSGTSAEVGDNPRHVFTGSCD